MQERKRKKEAQSVYMSDEGKDQQSGKCTKDDDDQVLKKRQESGEKSVTAGRQQNREKKGGERHGNRGREVAR